MILLKRIFISKITIAIISQTSIVTLHIPHTNNYIHVCMKIQIKLIFKL